MTDRHDVRYVSSDDPQAKLRAWGGATPSDATLDMGGWTDYDEESFREAVQDEAQAHGGKLEYVEIIPAEKKEEE